MSDTRSSSRIAEIPPEQLSPAQAAVLQTLQQGRGRIPTPYKVWLHSARLAECLHPLGVLFTQETLLTKREVEIVILTAAAHWNCEYVLTGHAREARAVGLTDDVIEGIRQHRDVTLPDAREQAVLDIARSSADSESAPDEVFNRSVHALGHAGVAELLALFGYFTAVSLAMKLYRVSA